MTDDPATLERAADGIEAYFGDGCPEYVMVVKYLRNLAEVARADYDPRMDVVRAQPIHTDRDYGHLEGSFLVHCFGKLCPWFDKYPHGLHVRHRILTPWEKAE